MTRFSPARGLFYILLVAAIVALPYVTGEFRVTQFSYVGVFAIALIGLSILTGITGQISLGHGGFMAIGAYVTGILAGNHGVPELLTLPLAGPG